MIHIDQVRTLEIKVKQAVQLVVHLRRENDHLRSRLADTEVRIQEMEELLSALKTAQTQIELGIQSALNDLGQIDSEPPEVADAGEVPVASEKIVFAENLGSDSSQEHQEIPFELAENTVSEFSAEDPVNDDVLSGSDAPSEQDNQPSLGIF
jgi:chromosome segregation ATPase